jgi:hypothetical protein
MPHWAELAGWTDPERIRYRPLRKDVFDRLEERGDIVKPPGQGESIDVSPSPNGDGGDFAQSRERSDTRADAQRAARQSRTPTRRVRTVHDVTGSILPLIEAGLVAPGDELLHDQARTGVRLTATVTAEGRLQTSAGIFDAPSSALRALVGYEVNGWKTWIHRPTGRSLAALRDRA